jgi:hypothetical protein
MANRRRAESLVARFLATDTPGILASSNPGT